MARNVPYNDFDGQLTRRDTRGWGADVERNSIAADSEFTMPSERLRTQTVYVPSAAERREQKKARRGVPQATYAPMSGKFEQRPIDVMRQIRDSAGAQVYRSSQKLDGEE